MEEHGTPELRGLRFDLNLGSQHKVQDRLITVLVNTQEVVAMSCHQ